MSDFFGGVCLGVLFTLFTCWLAFIADMGNTIKEYKHAHCRHLDSRVEYQKCFNEFKPVNPNSTNNQE